MPASPKWGAPFIWGAQHQVQRQLILHKSKLWLARHNEFYGLPRTETAFTPGWQLSEQHRYLTRGGFQAKGPVLKECQGLSAPKFLVCWMLCQRSGLPLPVGVHVPVCAICVHTTHTLLPMEPALACQSHILQIRLDRPSYPKVGICLLSCAKSLMSFGPEFCSVWNGHQERGGLLEEERSVHSRPKRYSQGPDSSQDC